MGISRFRHITQLHASSKPTCTELGKASDLLPAMGFLFTLSHANFLSPQYVSQMGVNYNTSAASFPFSLCPPAAKRANKGLVPSSNVVRRKAHGSTFPYVPPWFVVPGSGGFIALPSVYRD